ncbi:membrane transporter, partial [Schizosaccharomyces japonicus yFS275]
YSENFSSEVSNAVKDSDTVSSVKTKDELSVQRVYNETDPLENHPAHPKKWPFWKKIFLTCLTCSLQCFIFLTPNAYPDIQYSLQAKWNLTSQVSILGQSMFILGVSLGPLFLGPFSDLAGRKWVYVGTMVFYLCFNVSCALARNYAQLVISMFILGICGSTALGNVAGGVADLFDDDESHWGMYIFIFMCSLSTFGSPEGVALVNDKKLGWQWLYWINVIVSGAYLVVFSLMPETLPSIIISKYEKKRGGNTDFIPRMTARKFADKTVFVFTNAIKIFFTEPIVAALGIYNGFVNGLLYFFLAAIWPVFVNIYKMADLSASFTYLAAIPACIILLFFEPLHSRIYSRDKQANNGVARPEARLKVSLVYIWLFPIGIFMFAFCSQSYIHWIVPLIGLTFFNIADYHIWQVMLLYITDSYPSVSASAVAAFELPSNLGAAGFTHLSALMFARMNVHWATAVVGFCSLPLIVLINVLYFKGQAIRARSRLCGAAKQGNSV